MATLRSLEKATESVWAGDPAPPHRAERWDREFDEFVLLLSRVATELDGSLPRHVETPIQARLAEIALHRQEHPGMYAELLETYGRWHGDPDRPPAALQL